MPFSVNMTPEQKHTEDQPPMQVSKHSEGKGKARLQFIEVTPSTCSVSDRDDGLDGLLPDDDNGDKGVGNKGGLLQELQAIKATKEDGAEEGGEDIPFHFSGDIFSVLFLVEMNSWAFLYSMFVIWLQFLILFLIPVDLLRDEDVPSYGRGFLNDKNPFNLPLTVEPQVVGGQAVAFLIAFLLTNSDLGDAFALLSLGYHRAFSLQFPGASRIKFVFVVFLRFLVFWTVNLVSFLFIIQSTTVLDLFQNFAAVTFVVEMDNLAFQVAQNGWLGDTMEHLTESIESLELTYKRRRWIETVRHILPIFLLGWAYLAWGIILKRQLDGTLIQRVACSHLDVHFGPEVYVFPDDTSFALPLDEFGEVKNTKYRPPGKHFNTSSPPNLHYEYFSGRYEALLFGKGGGVRPFYFENGVREYTTGWFYYCDYERAWAFTIPIFMHTAIPSATIDPRGRNGCEYGWLMLSPVTDAYTLDEAPEEGWRMWTGELDEAKEFTITCAECQADLDCGLSARGVCRNDLCQCQEGVAEGTFCHYDLTCPHLVLFFAEEQDVWNEFEYPYYNARSEVKTYRRPVFYIEFEAINSTEVVLYTGNRWYNLIYEDMNWDDVKADFFTFEGNGFFHSYWDELIEDTKNLAWYSDQTDSFSPTGTLTWYLLGETGSAGGYEPFGYFLEHYLRFECLAVDCKRNNICGRYGNCIPDATLVQKEQISYDVRHNDTITGGKCSCHDGYAGWYCEYKASEFASHHNDSDGGDGGQNFHLPS